MSAETEPHQTADEKSADEEPTDGHLAEIEAEKKEEPDPDENAPKLNVLKIYLRGLGKIRLLTDDEVADLSKQIDPFRERYLALFEETEAARKVVEDNTNLPEKKDIDLLKKLKAEMETYDRNPLFNQPVNALISHNLKWVVSIAKRYMHLMPIEDLITFGNDGLRKAAIKFDWRRGNTFSTYATWWIRQAITREIKDKRISVRIPVHHVEALSRMGKAVTRLNSKGNLGPTDEEIAKEMDAMEKERVKKATARGEKVGKAKPVTAAQIKFWRQSGEFMKCASLQDRPKHYARDSDGTTEEITSDTGTEGKRHTRGPEADLVTESTGKIAHALLSVLDKRTQRIMRKRFLEGKTLEQTGNDFDLTRERVRQIQNKTLKKLRTRGKGIYNEGDERTY